MMVVNKKKQFIITLGLSIGLIFIGCIDSSEKQYECKCDVNDKISIIISGEIRDVGLSDVEYSREIKVIKKRDTLSFKLEHSEWKGVEAKIFIPDSLKTNNRYLIITNVDNPYFRAVNLKKFRLIDRDRFKELFGYPSKIITPTSYLCGDENDLNRPANE